MTGDSCSNVGSKKSLPALGDMTNLPSKRGVSSILGDLLLKSGDESGKTVVLREESRAKFSKRLCLVVEDLVKENSRGSDSNTGSASFGDKKDESDALNVDVQSCKADGGDAAAEIAGGDGHVFKEGCVSNSSVHICVENVEKGNAQASNVASNANQCDVICEGSARSGFSSNSGSRDELVMGENRTAERQGSPYSQNYTSFEMSRCSMVEKMGNVNHNMGADLLKSCSCSFCLKAAYIWSDLHYQDIKGRLSVLKKSQKEANNLIRRNSRGKPTDFRGSAKSSISTKLESDLMSQWMSLFLNMEDILSCESNHLQKRFAAMKVLRENCKMDLERSTKTPQD